MKQIKVSCGRVKSRKTSLCRFQLKDRRSTLSYRVVDLFVISFSDRRHARISRDRSWTLYSLFSQFVYKLQDWTTSLITSTVRMSSYRRTELQISISSFTKSTSLKRIRPYLRSLNFPISQKKSNLQSAHVRSQRLPIELCNYVRLSRCQIVIIFESCSSDFSCKRKIVMNDMGICDALLDHHTTTR